MTTTLTTLTNTLAINLGMPDGANDLVKVLKATAFKGEVSDAQMTALVIVANQYKLNPWTKEIYAYVDKRQGVIPVVGVDGWSRIINSNPMFDGMEFKQDAESCTCVIYRKDRSHPISVTEWLVECSMKTGPWITHPKRMLRHKAMIQCARLAFGFVGIYDQDEADRILDAIDKQPATKLTPDAAAMEATGTSEYDEFEQAHLQPMREAAMRGLEALQAAFKAIPSGAHKTAFWQKHQESLKKATITTIDADTGEVVQND